jgi:ABC-type uncharacterized transport system auxiliary subunit
VKHRKLGTILVISAACLSGCYFGKVADYRYYVLDYVPDKTFALHDGKPWPATVLVRNFQIGEAYLRSEIAFRTSEEEIRYRPYDRWAVRPDHVVSDMVRRHLVESNLFRTIQSQYEEDSPEYELRGRVIALEEQVEPPFRYAHMDLRMDFVRLSDNAVLWGREFDLRTKVEGTDELVLVHTLSEMLRSSMDTTIAAMDSAMGRLPSSH